LARQMSHRRRVQARKCWLISKKTFSLFIVLRALFLA
jgi:hypothetical protein